MLCTCSHMRPNVSSGPPDSVEDLQHQARERRASLEAWLTSACCCIRRSNPVSTLFVSPCETSHTSCMATGARGGGIAIDGATRSSDDSGALVPRNLHWKVTGVVAAIFRRRSNMLHIRCCWRECHKRASGRGSKQWVSE